MPSGGETPSSLEAEALGDLGTPCSAEEVPSSSSTGTTTSVEAETEGGIGEAEALGDLGTPRSAEEVPSRRGGTSSSTGTTTSVEAEMEGGIGDQDCAGCERVSNAKTRLLTAESRMKIREIVDNTKAQWLPKEAHELFSEFKSLLEGSTTVEQVGQKAQELLEVFLQDLDEKPDDNAWSNLKASIRQEGLKDWSRLCGSWLPSKLKDVADQPGGVTMFIQFAISVYQAVTLLGRYKCEGGTEDTLRRIWDVIKTGIIPPVLHLGLKPSVATKIGWVYAEQVVASVESAFGFVEPTFANRVQPGENAAELATPTDGVRPLDVQGGNESEEQALQAQLTELIAAGDECMGPSPGRESGDAGENKGVSERLRKLWQKVKEGLKQPRERHGTWAAVHSGGLYSSDLTGHCQTLLHSLLREAKDWVLEDSGLVDEELRGKFLACEKMMQQWLGCDSVSFTASRAQVFLKEEHVRVVCKSLSIVAACIGLARILNQGWRLRQREISRDEFKKVVLEELAGLAVAVIMPEIYCAAGLSYAAAAVACVVTKKLCELGVDYVAKQRRQLQEKKDEPQLQEEKKDEEPLQEENKDEERLQEEEEKNRGQEQDQEEEQAQAQARSGVDEEEDQEVNGGFKGLSKKDLKEALEALGLQPNPTRSEVETAFGKKGGVKSYNAWMHYGFILIYYGWF